MWLSAAHGSASAVALHFTWDPTRPPSAPAIAAVEEALAPFAPRPHWGKVFTIPPEVVAAQYAHLSDAVALQRELDPAGKFRNAMLERYLG